jgi:hypothetical protein
VKFRDYAKNIAETKANMSTDASSAFFSMTQAEYAAGNFKQKVAEGGMTARVRVGAGVDNVAGVKLPVFTKYDTGAQADNQSLGLVGGGKKIVAVREKFTIMLEMLIKYVNLFIGGGCINLLICCDIKTNHLFILQACITADKFRHFGRSPESYQPSCECLGKRHYPQN